MKNQKTDRRIQRTEKAFQEALMSLIIKKGFADITVQDILDEANMGRSTFYAHYRDKRDLLTSGFQSLLDTFIREYTLIADQQTDPETVEKEITLFLFQHANDQRLLFKSMTGKKGREEIHRIAQEFLTQITNSFYSRHYQDLGKRFPLNLLVNFTISNFLVVLAWWLEQNETITAQEINTLYWNLAGPGIQFAMKSLNKSS